MKNLLYCLLVAIGGLTISACTNVYSSKNLAVSNANTNGLTYALPTTWIEISGRQNEDQDGVMIIEVSSRTLPDAGHIYSLDHVASAFARDELTIEVGADQLLVKIDTTTEDVTDQIIVTLAKTISGLASFSLPPVGEGFRSTDYACSAPPAAPWSVIIDPFEQKTWPNWLNPGCLILTPITEIIAPATKGTRLAENCSKGICHRAPVPHRVEIDFGPAGVHQFIAGLLNDAPILSIDVNRTLFVEKQMNLEFTGGVLTKVNIVSPSPVLEAVSLPLDVAKALLSAPAEILRLRVDYSSQAIADRQKERELLEANRDFEEFVRELTRQEVENQKNTDTGG